MKTQIMRNQTNKQTNKQTNVVGDVLRFDHEVVGRLTF